jgi:hypothetical protein
MVASLCASIALFGFATKQMTPAIAAALLGGLAMQFVDEAEPGGIEGRLTRTKIRSPLDWRVRQLADEASWSAQPLIWGRRVVLAASVLAWGTTWF